ncbi:alpha/beta-hydrolase [Fomitiporia mediterranea MF3/22]|uniref:alpha/beta-hydrolase n=1 Tax=Fomitiporia mediterranea (strain MF3/22) TaxID=694068 RepID=UPI0004407EBC|nr:alpha/beta-hydrolase [Fomitiporia mediterranea MF3/22]EJC98931.1 alpha/beta-hydrolase [Fomitiporia mediterranea MF3/22]
MGAAALAQSTFASQFPLTNSLPFDASVKRTMLDWKSDDFKFKGGPDVFTPKDLVELPRPGSGTANPGGDLALVSVSTYSFKDKKNNKSIWLAPLESSISPLEIPLANGGDAFWLDDRTIGHVVAGADGKGSELFTISVKFETTTSSPNHPATLSAPESPALVGSFPAGVSPANFRYVGAAERLVFSAYVYADGKLETVQEQNEAYESRGNTALVYDETFERHWDTWTGPKRSKLFTVRLVKGTDGKWVLGDEFAAPLRDLKHDVPVEPFGGLDDFSVSSTHIVYTTKDPKLPAALHTKQNIYVVDLLGKGAPRELTSGNQGATHNPVFSHDGTKVAWTELDKDGYESDRAKIVIFDLTKVVRYTLSQAWDRSAGELAFSADDKALIITAGEHAHVKIFRLQLPPTPEDSTTNPTFPDGYDPIPKALTHSHASSAPQPLPRDGRILFTQSSLTSPNDVFILSPDGSSITQITKFTAKHLKGKDLDPGESFWFEGAEGKKVQGWVHKPKGWKEGVKKSVPVVLLIHGGPQGAWEDQWSTRWNPNVFAQQGYFVVAINPTGSTTFGQAFTDAITKDWGGKPFVDLRKGWQFVLDKYPEIDAERAVAAGASWGGYAINWIQGHPDYGFGFKALVCHDGVFDTPYNGFSTDELFFFNHDFGGPPWDSEAKPVVDKFSPSNFIQNWSTPQLIIHGSKDFRLPDTEGIGAWHALQTRGIPSRLVIFPDENHWVLNHGNSLKWHFEVFRWFDKFVGVSGLHKVKQEDKDTVEAT